MVIDPRQPPKSASCESECTQHATSPHRKLSALSYTYIYIVYAKCENINPRGTALPRVRSFVDAPIRQFAISFGAARPSPTRLRRAAQTAKVRCTHRAPPRPAPPSPNSADRNATPHFLARMRAHAYLPAAAQSRGARATATLLSHMAIENFGRGNIFSSIVTGTREESGGGK
ncbi:hypothetical protein V9T40_002952 [Parthenolecanium corni]|uniref:Uncharacterized protein n=1 Tax=Parthenolecanium corni TaxID=536013 RepID=A0AAN9TJB5_9HEMI